MTTPWNGNHIFQSLSSGGSKMRNVLKIIIFLIVVVNLFSENIFSQTDTPNLSETNKKDSINVDSNQVVVSDDNLPWANSLYISGGYGTPQGLRFELGYNFGSSISFALAYGKNDNWSRNPESGTIGIIFKCHFLQIQSVTAYILFGTGGTVDMLGNRVDSYRLIHIGSKIPLSNWLQLCTELGYVFTSKHISGGKSIFGSSPEVTETKTRFGFYISFEIDFRQIF